MADRQRRVVVGARRSSSGTNSSRGTRSIAASTRSSSMSRLRSCSSTISRRSARAVRHGVSARVYAALDAEVVEHERRDVGDRGRRGAVEPDREHRDLGVAREQRAVAAAAGVMAAAEIGELAARRGRDEHVAGVRVRQRGRRAREAVGIVEHVDAPRRRRAAPRRPRRPPGRARDLDGRVAVEPLRRAPRAARREGVDHPGAVRRGDDAVVAERVLEPRRSIDVRLAVVRADDDGVALEELVQAAGGVEQRAHGVVAARERCVRGVRALQRARRSRSRGGRRRAGRSRRA